MDSKAFDAELRIPSDLAYLRSVRAFIRELAENLGFDSDKIKDIEVATDEILSNAVEHGSKDVNSEIVIFFVTNEESIEIVVRDYGNGEPLTDKLSRILSIIETSNVENDKERGRGLLLARLLSDDMLVESNSAGGLDVHLVWSFGRDGAYCLKNNSLCY